MVFARATLALTLAAVAVSSSVAMPTIHPSVHRTLRQQGSVNLIITMKGQNDAPVATAMLKETTFTNRGDKITSLVADLEKHASESQSEMDALLAQETGSLEPLFTSQRTLWISNQKYIEGASMALLEKLATVAEIAEIREELVLPVPEVTVEEAPTNGTSIGLLANQWGVNKVAAPSVWASGNTGSGVVVGHIDTGVRATHTLVRSNYRSSYGWYDPSTRTSRPTDNNGHGTHTMGTIVGSSGYGVAPGAQWISCRGCTTSGCSESDLLTCAQFMTCPTDTNGRNADCSKAPDLVSNSWGGGQGDSFYSSAVNAWRAAGIIPVFANGNAGPSCTTSNSPGDYTTVITVGSTTSSDSLSSFSSKGPTRAGVLKPEISAPGSSVVSAYYTSDSATATLSGTSMATPHVSGVIALLLSAKPGLSFTAVKSALTSGADRNGLASTGYRCGGTSDGSYPNNMYGYGRANAVKTVAA